MSDSRILDEIAAVFLYVDGINPDAVYSAGGGEIDGVKDIPDNLGGGAFPAVVVLSAEKAIIFTDSTKTQEYIAQALKDTGKGDGILLFNGSNASPEQSAIYRDWPTRSTASCPAVLASRCSKDAGTTCASTRSTTEPTPTTTPPRRNSSHPPVFWAGRSPG